MACAMSSWAEHPWTIAGERIISAENLPDITFLMSWITAPVDDVTTPILTGYFGGCLFRS